MNNSTIEIEINGEVFRGWERQAIDFDIETVSSAFSLSAFDKDGILGGLSGSVPCNLYVVNGDIRQLVLTGYTVERERSIDAGSNLVTVSGNDKLIDAVECSVILDSQMWIKKRFSAIVRDLLTSTFGISVDSSALKDDPIIERFSIQSGETAFDAVERLCRGQAVLPMSTFDGKLALTYAADESHRAVNDLVLGKNIKSIRETTNWSDRFSDYIALAQTSGNGKRWTKAMIQGKATAQDRSVTRHRPKLFIAERRTEHDDLVKRVRWEAQVRAGRGTDRSVVVSGWFQKDTNGSPVAIWEKNKRTRLVVDDDGWGIDEDVLISSVSFSIDENGEQTVLGLRHPDIYKANPVEKVEMT